MDQLGKVNKASARRLLEDLQGAVERGGPESIFRIVYVGQTRRDEWLRFLEHMGGHGGTVLFGISAALRARAALHGFYILCRADEIRGSALAAGVEPSHAANVAEMGLAHVLGALRSSAADPETNFFPGNVAVGILRWHEGTDGGLSNC
jgi:hypothetical protein